MKSVLRPIIALMVLVPLAATAQEPQERKGFGISFGLGGGSASVDCSGCNSDRETGFSGYLRLGGHVRPDLMVAFESNGYTKSSDGVDTSGGFYSVALQWYPNVEKGFYMKGNLGVAAVLEDYDDGDEFTVAAPGVGLGVGYDLRLGKNFSLTPYMNLVFTGNGDVKYNDSSTGVNARFNLIQIGLGFTWH